MESNTIMYEMITQSRGLWGLSSFHPPQFVQKKNHEIADPI